MKQDRDESVLSRWSRRKFEAGQEPAGSEQPLEPEQIAVVDESATEQVEAPPLTDADMPDVESLTEDSDFSPFMSAGVSDELRNLALRKLFRAPVFNIRDGLDEYDEDFTSFEKLGDIVTCDMKHQIEMQEQKMREALAAENETGAELDLEAVESVEDEDEDVVEDEDDEERPGRVVVAAEDRKEPGLGTNDE